MIEVSPFTLLALGELLLISIIVSLGLVIAGLLRKSREKRAIATLISRIKEDEPRRKSETRTLMQESYGFEGSQLDAVVNKIAREEKRLYQALINLFLKRDTNIMEVLHVECEGVTEPYRTLEPPKPEVTNGGSQDELETDLATEVERLKEENERLTTELGVTMNTMGAMLKEYASMYAASGKELDETKLVESLKASANSEEESEPEAEHPAEGDMAETVADQDSIAGEVFVEQEEIAQTPEERGDLDLLDDVEDMDIGEMLGDETVAIGDIENLSGLNDETLVMDVDDNELVELDDEDLNLDQTLVDDGRLLGDSADEKKQTG